MLAQETDCCTPLKWSTAVTQLIPARHNCSSADLIRVGVGVIVCLGISGVFSESCRIDRRTRCGWPPASLQLIPTERATKQPTSNELSDQNSLSAPNVRGNAIIRKRSVRVRAAAYRERRLCTGMAKHADQE